MTSENIDIFINNRSGGPIGIFGDQENEHDASITAGRKRNRQALSINGRQRATDRRTGKAMRFLFLTVAVILLNAEFALAVMWDNGNSSEYWLWILVLLIPLLVALGIIYGVLKFIYNILKKGLELFKSIKDKIGQFIDNWPTVDPPPIYSGLVVYQKRLTVDKVRVVLGEEIFISWSFAMRNTDNLTVKIKSFIIVEGVEVKKQEETINAGARGFAIAHTMFFPTTGLKQVIGIVSIKQVDGDALTGDGDLKTVEVVMPLQDKDKDLDEDLDKEGKG